MSHNQATQHHSIRLRHYDYAQPGWYFITICTLERKVAFGDVVDDKMCLNASGELAQKTWTTLAERFSFVQLDAFVVMPNHVHGIIILADAQTSFLRQDPDSGSAPERLQASIQTKRSDHPVPSSSLGEVVRTFKGAATYLIRRAGNPTFAWQARYYEHIIRNQQELDRIRAYIETNPARWAQDTLYK
ncbi:MAG TPA: transposase [Ktedonobacteraceae bacterium]|nr:transposase [Ktedonobacteraceae bacterium]